MVDADLPALLFASYVAMLVFLGVMDLSLSWIQRGDEEDED